MDKNKVINRIGIVALGVAVLSALAGYTYIATANIGIYLISLYFTKGN